MKRIFILLLILLLLLNITACGQEQDDSISGIYNAVSCTYREREVACEDDWLELNPNGRGILIRKGMEYPISWELEGMKLTVIRDKEESYGRLFNGIISLTIDDYQYTYKMDPFTDENGTLRGHLHVWQEADCVNPAKCLECGVSEGGLIEHIPLEANYQDPSVCKTCGMEMGEKLQADMELYGVTEFMEAGVTYPYNTILKDSAKTPTVGEVKVLSYEIFPSSDQYPARAGYEWRVVKIRMSFSGYPEWRNGIYIKNNLEDYYDIRLLDDTLVHDADSNTDTYQVSYHGQRMDVTRIQTTTWGKWTRKDGKRWIDGEQIYAYCVPEGYDGVVIGIRNAAVDWPQGTHLYDVYNTRDFLLFRLN